MPLAHLVHQAVLQAQQVLLVPQDHKVYQVHLPVLVLPDLQDQQVLIQQCLVQQVLPA